VLQASTKFRNHEHVSFGATEDFHQGTGHTDNCQLTVIACEHNLPLVQGRSGKIQQPKSK